MARSPTGCWPRVHEPALRQPGRPPRVYRAGGTHRAGYRAAAGRPRRPGGAYGVRRSYWAARRPERRAEPHDGADDPAGWPAAAAAALVLVDTALDAVDRRDRHHRPRLPANRRLGRARRAVWRAPPVRRRHPPAARIVRVALVLVVVI